MGLLDALDGVLCVALKGQLLGVVEDIPFGGLTEKGEYLIGTEADGIEPWVLLIGVHELLLELVLLGVTFRQGLEITVAAFDFTSFALVGAGLQTEKGLLLANSGEIVGFDGFRG